MDPESSRKRLPFEPGGKSTGKPAKAAPSSGAVPKASRQPSAKKTTSGKKSASTAIPEEVSGRMLRRMLAFSGTPTVLGILTFFVSYYLVANQAIDLPPYFVLLITLAFFGLGVVGLTYGVLSASWDEGRPGTLLGFDEFQVNFGRMTSAWGAKSNR